MPPITLELLRKRAEHNEGIVSTLEEVSLHQQNIERIEGLGQLCKHLKILLLQNNLIGRIENLHKLKELEYINLALNNIVKIENLQRCESLTKLDLTVNFIDKKGLLSIDSLAANYKLRDLYLTGNPCSDVSGYRQYVVATLPSLQRLDGVEIKPSERIAALQELPHIRERVLRELKADGVDIEAACKYCDARDIPDDVDDVDMDPNAPSPWTPEQRVREHKALERQREEQERKKKENSDKLLAGEAKKQPLRTGFDPLPTEPGARIFQKNEGDWDFYLGDSEDGKAIVLDVKIGKYIDTSLIDVDVQPTVVRCLLKGQLLQLCLSEEVSPSLATSQRSKTTGCLQITMPKVQQTSSRGVAVHERTYITSLKAAQQKAAVAASVAAKGKQQQDGGKKDATDMKQVSVVRKAVVVAAGDDDDEPPPL